MLLKELIGPIGPTIGLGGLFSYSSHPGLSPSCERLARAQPNTDVAVRAGVWPLTSDSIERTPVLSPACPRNSVMPPLKRRRPSRSNRSVWPDVSAPNWPASTPSMSDRTARLGLPAALRRRSVASHATQLRLGFRQS